MKFVLLAFLLAHSYVPAQAATPDLKTAMAMTEEALSLGDGNVAGIKARLPGFLKKRYGYQIGCESGLLGWGSLSDVKCAMGLRNFARALYSSSIPADKAHGAVLTVAIRDTDTVPNVIYDVDRLIVQLPANLTANQMATFLNGVRESLSYQKRVFELSQYLNMLDVLKANLSVPMEFDPTLSRTEKWTAVMNLTAVAQADMSLFGEPADLIYVTKKAQPLHENSLQLQVDLSAEASPQELEQELAANHSPTAMALVSKSQSVREEVERIQEDLTKAHGLQPDCSGFGDLTLEQCRLGLLSLAQFFMNHSDIRPLNSKILITSPAELNGCCDILPKQTFGLTYNFREADLNDFITSQGWSR